MQRQAMVFGLAVVLTTVFCVLAAMSVDLGIPGEWVPHLAKHRGAVAWPLCVVTSLLVAGVCAWACVRRIPIASKLGLPVVLAIQALSSLNFLTFACAGPYGVMELCTAIITSGGNGSYYAEAERIGPYAAPGQKRDPSFPHYSGLSEYLAKYASDMPKGSFGDVRVRTATHPPGSAIAMYLVHSMLRRSPRLVSGLERAYSRFLPLGEELFAHGRPAHARLMTCAAVTIAVVCSITASLCVWLTYCASRSFALGHGSWVAMGLVAQAPCLLLFNPGVDQVFATIALAVIVLAVWALGQRGLVWPILAGLAASAATVFSLALCAVAGFGLLIACCEGFISHDGQARRAMRNAVVYAAAGLALWPIVWLCTGYDHFSVLWHCRASNAIVQSARGYWAWLGMNIVAWTAFAGGSAASAGSVGIVLGIRRGGPRMALPLAFALTLFVLLVSGQTRGEVERLWAFLTPILVVAAIHGLSQSMPDAMGKAAAGLLLFLQSVHAVVYRVVYDVWSTAP